jgi:hypothetical protein
MNDSRIRFDIWARVEKLRLVPPDPSYRAKPFLAVDLPLVFPKNKRPVSATGLPEDYNPCAHLS